jgi:hypothetical protein
MSVEAATKALLDGGLCPSPWMATLTQDPNIAGYAGITYDEIETAFVGYCYGDSTSGQVRPKCANCRVNVFTSI